MQFTATQTTTRTTAHSPTTVAATAHSRRATITLWAIQGALATIFLFAGASKLVMPAGDLTQDTWLPALFLRFIGVCEVLGAKIGRAHV